MGKKNRISVLELVKDVLILALSISALWIVAEGELRSWVQSRLREELPEQYVAQDTQLLAEAARPLGLTATTLEGDRKVRSAIRYDREEVGMLFQQTAGFLRETLSSAQTPEAVSRRDWERALATAPGLCFDFGGELPLSVLCGWLSADSPLPEARVRRLLLTQWEGEVALYYRDLTEGTYFRAGTSVVHISQLEQALTGLTGNEAYYAFEDPNSREMDPDTLMVPGAAYLPAVAGTNPVGGGRSALSGLMEDLEFDLAGCAFYSAAHEEVARAGSDTIRLNGLGVVEYHDGSEGEARFPLVDYRDQSGCFAAVESCRQVALRAMGPRIGGGRLYLEQVQQTQTGWEVCFNYEINGIPVVLRDGCAAEFQVDGQGIRSFTLRMRGYQPIEELCPMLPPVQAAAAMQALETGGGELTILYRDNYEEILRPEWSVDSP